MIPLKDRIESFIVDAFLHELPIEERHSMPPSFTTYRIETEDNASYLWHSLISLDIADHSPDEWPRIFAHAIDEDTSCQGFIAWFVIESVTLGGECLAVIYTSGESPRLQGLTIDLKTCESLSDLSVEDNFPMLDFDYSLDLKSFLGTLSV